MPNSTELHTPKSKKLFIVSSAKGCVSNLIETTSIRSALNPAELASVESADDADVIFVNTCGYSQAAEDHSMEMIQGLEREHPGKKIVVGGCLPRINDDRLRGGFSGTIVRTGDWDALGSALGSAAIDLSRARKESGPIDPTDLETRLHFNRRAERLAAPFFRVERFLGLKLQPLHNVFEGLVFDERTFALSVSRGCLGRCTYCAIKKAKGRLVSRALEELVAEFRGALNRGFTRIHLVADDVGCWGRDIGLTSGTLLQSFLSDPRDFKLVIDYFDPTWLVAGFNELKRTLADRRVACVNFPVQSGSQAVLDRMGRDYRLDEVLGCLREIRAANPDLVLKTHVLVGFPGETEMDFQESLAVLDDFDLVFPNLFAARPLTPAALMEQLPVALKKARFKRLQSKVRRRHRGTVLKSLTRGLWARTSR